MEGDGDCDFFVERRRDDVGRGVDDGFLAMMAAVDLLQMRTMALEAFAGVGRR